MKSCKRPKETQGREEYNNKATTTTTKLRNIEGKKEMCLEWKKVLKKEGKDEMKKGLKKRRIERRKRGKKEWKKGMIKDEIIEGGDDGKQGKTREKKLAQLTVLFLPFS